MGVNHHVKTKYVFRLQLPLPFFRSKPMDRKGKRVDNDIDTEEEEAYGNVGPTVHVRYESDVESEVGSDEDIDPLDLDGPARSHRRLVSWDGVKDHVRCRWTEEQERKLVHAQSELARCQKAWSSEQDIWLKCVSLNLSISIRSIYFTKVD
ncbi:uncharacterized protein BJX67DRAFT_338730 [Aspergillus lucknowensis]|uniref:Myb-like domain-containing protein n=1 Tax=Aspergillus lucknowensis TaxID=176173 RepID=A0ABR4L633_9EURO